MYATPIENPKIKKDDRILVLKQREGVKTLSSTGLVDSRLFTGENNLHVIKEINSNNWYFKYDSGGLPEALKQKFTTFGIAYAYAKKYFEKRNIYITEVID